MSGPQVLVVEDEQLICALLMEALEDEGVTAVCASTAEEALARLDETATIRVLITDINLGRGMDGYELAERAREALADVFVIYVSGHAEAEVAVRGVTGAMMVPKPYSPVQLAARIAALAPLVGRY